MLAPARGDLDNSLYTVLSVSLPPSDISEMLLFNLDIAGISASGGSACTSGANAGSHVLSGINADPNRPAVRFSFSKYSTEKEVDFVVCGTGLPCSIFAAACARIGKSVLQNDRYLFNCIFY